ncbi:hypothetical protein V6N13_034199 [Hibiscus sabdariffa]
MCSNFWPCTDHPMDHGLNGHCLKGLCPGDRRPPPPHKVHLAPIGRYNYPRRHSKLFIAANSASLACKAARQVELSLRAKEMHFCTGTGKSKISLRISDLNILVIRDPTHPAEQSSVPFFSAASFRIGDEWSATIPFIIFDLHKPKPIALATSPA